jgi:hypothetical protein
VEFTQEEIKELQSIYREEVGIEISEEDAKIEGSLFIELLGRVFIEGKKQ